MRNLTFDADIAVVARSQHGVFTTAQARALGGTPAVLRNRLANGVVLQLAPKVWAAAAHPATWQRQFKAAELSLSRAAFCDGAAAWILELDGARLGRPALVVSYEANRRQALASVHRRREVAVTTVHGFRVTTPAQTLFDLLACWRLGAVERALDGALLTGKVSIAELAERGQAMASLRRPAAATWAALVDERTDLAWEVADSELEVALQRILRRLPVDVRVRLQSTPPWWRAGRQRVDAYLPEWRLIIEADGRRWHARVADFERDRARDNVAAAHGHRVLRFTHTMLTTRPADVLHLVLAAAAMSTPLAA